MSDSCDCLGGVIETLCEEEGCHDEPHSVISECHCVRPDHDELRRLLASLGDQHRNTGCICSDCTRFKVVATLAIPRMLNEIERLRSNAPTDQDAMCADCAKDNDLEARAGCPVCGKDFL